MCACVCVLISDPESCFAVMGPRDSPRPLAAVLALFRVFRGTKRQTANPQWVQKVFVHWVALIQLSNNFCQTKFVKSVELYSNTVTCICILFFANLCLCKHVCTNMSYRKCQSFAKFAKLTRKLDLFNKL